MFPFSLLQQVGMPRYAQILRSTQDDNGPSPVILSEAKDLCDVARTNAKGEGRRKLSVNNIKEGSSAFDKGRVLSII